MRRIERRITISAPVPNVFSYLADFPRHSEWAAQPLRIRQTSEGPVGVGSTFVSVGRQFGRENENHITVVKFIPNERIVFESAGQSRAFPSLLHHGRGQWHNKSREGGRDQPALDGGSPPVSDLRRLAGD